MSLNLESLIKNDLIIPKKDETRTDYFVRAINIKLNNPPLQKVLKSYTTTKEYKIFDFYKVQPSIISKKNNLEKNSSHYGGSSAGADLNQFFSYFVNEGFNKKSLIPIIYENSKNEELAVKEATIKTLQHNIISDSAIKPQFHAKEGIIKALFNIPASNRKNQLKTASKTIGLYGFYLTPPILASIVSPTFIPLATPGIYLCIKDLQDIKNERIMYKATNKLINLDKGLEKIIPTLTPDEIVKLAKGCSLDDLEKTELEKEMFKILSTA
ncbi:MAG: hypothetical protein GON13_03505 [Nanoarchaeota archaeon]|nr:hypothetical protein [Nanoarchaeota archaeon]